jgi:hypothetical protein
MEVVSWQMFKFCAVLTIKNTRGGFSWRLVVVYGPAYDEFKLDFIFELHSVMGNWPGPNLIGGILIWSGPKREEQWYNQFPTC